MPSSAVFSTNKVMFGCAPFTNAKIGYNAAAGCLNLIVSGSTRGAVPLVEGLNDGLEAPKLLREGASCKVGCAVEVDFDTEEQAGAFEDFVLGIKVPVEARQTIEMLRCTETCTSETTGKGKVPRTELHGRPLELFMCSVLKRQGYGEGFRWISQYLD